MAELAGARQVLPIRSREAGYRTARSEKALFSPSWDWNAPGRNPRGSIQKKRAHLLGLISYLTAGPARRSPRA